MRIRGRWCCRGSQQERYQLDVQVLAVSRDPHGRHGAARASFAASSPRIDHGLVTVGANGSLSMLSEFIGPHLEHTATIQPDGYLVHFREPGDDF